MSKKYVVNWGIWIGVWTGIYVFLYLMSPLAKYGVIWCTFIALPIYFNGGAQPKDYVSYVTSSICGVCWGLIFIFFIELFQKGGMGNVPATALGCLIFTALCCLHMMVPDKGLLNKVPAMFGGISATFSQWGTNVVPVTATLCLGVTLALICGLGTKVLKEDGSWSFGKNTMNL